jgi:hypothetical protein
MLKLFKTLLAVCLVVTFSDVSAQSNYKYRLKKMQAENAKIEKYIRANVANTPRADINAFIKTLIPTADHPKKFTQSEIDASVKTFKKRYWRIHYFSKYPAVYSLFTDQPVLNCENGDFEDGNLNGFILESSDASTGDGYNGGHCDWDPTSIMYTPEFEGFNEDNFLIVDDAEQDSITGFDMVHGGNFAVKLNSAKPLETALLGNNLCYPYKGVQKLSKKIVLESTGEELSLYFALVLEEAGHIAVEDQPIFIALARAENGTVLDKICNVAIPGPFFDEYETENDADCPHNTVLGKDWDCESLEVSGDIGDTITLEIYVTDCGAGGHFGYAYVDDICEPCIKDSCNNTGGIDLNPSDPCFDTEGFFQVCGTYTLPALNCEDGTLENIQLYVVQGTDETLLTLDASQININEDDQTFCFTLAADDFPSVTDGNYDFLVVTTFEIDNETFTQNDYNTNPGEANDVEFDCTPVCCRVRPNENSIQNPQFSGGLGGFGSEYDMISTIDYTSIYPGAVTVGDSSDGLVISSTWDVGCNDGNNHLFVNGLTGQTGSSVIYSNTVQVSEGRYTFCGNFKNLAQCGFDVLPTITIHFDGVTGYDLEDVLIDVADAGCDWQLLNQIIDVPGGLSSIDIEIILDETPLGDGNDLAIDNLVFAEIDAVAASQMLFDITPIPLFTTAYTFEAEPVSTIPNSCSYSWTVAEIDGAFDDIPGTVVENPIQWQTYPDVNDFIGYNGTSTLSGTNPGVFQLADAYRITFTKWCECLLPSSRTYHSFPGKSSARVPTLKLVEEKNTKSTRSEAHLGDDNVLNNASLGVYPSPTKEYINVDLRQIGQSTINILDNQGKVVRSDELDGTEVKSFKVDDLGQGVYFVKVIELSSGNTFVQKFIKQ